MVSEVIMHPARSFWKLVLALALVLGASAGAWADDKDKPAEQHGDKKDEKHKDKHDDQHGKKDAFNLFAGELDLAIWTVVVFLLLFFILSKYAWGPMLVGLKKREENIRTAVEEAKIARAETERMRGEFRRELDAAHQEIPKLMEDARRKAQELAEEIRSKANADIAAERQRLRREIDTATDQALQQIWTSVAQIAGEIASKAIRRSLTPEDHQRLVEEALNEMREQGAQHVQDMVGSQS